MTKDLVLNAKNINSMLTSQRVGEATCRTTLTGKGETRYPQILTPQNFPMFVPSYPDNTESLQVVALQ